MSSEDGVVMMKPAGIVTIWLCILHLKCAFVGQIKCDLEMHSMGHYKIVHSN